MKSLEMLEDLRFKGKGLPMLESYYEECYKKIKNDLQVLKILKKFVEIEFEDNDPYDECGWYDEIVSIRINLEDDTKDDEYKKIKSWIKEVRYNE